MRPYTNHTPKPLFTIGGRPLLEIIIDDLKKAGCEAVVINTHHLHHEIEAFVAARSYGLPVTTRHEPRILGTGGAIKNVSDFWDHRPFMVINADVVADFDLSAVYREHCRRRPAATLVLCDDPVFNSVAVAQDNRIAGFAGRDPEFKQSAERLLTFTGIQVLEPRVLDYLPAGRACSSIDAFGRMLTDGEKLLAHISPDRKWRDIGTPERYRQTAYESSLPWAFKEAFGHVPDQPADRIKLKGDGSERQWYRLESGGYSLIMADHGIREKRSTSEVDAFVNIGRHLHRRGVAVPRIHFADTFCGLVFLEDLGDVDLQQTARSTPDPQSLSDLYRSVIDRLVALWLQGSDRFDPAWTYQTESYDQNMILGAECRYFQEAFLERYLQMTTRYEDLAADFAALASRALRFANTVFMHRDMQSRNIMIQNGQVYFIDFQGGRWGPLQYDLASLLIDPYVELPDTVRADLLAYCIQALGAAMDLDEAKFRRCFHYCCLTRNLQILGAFAFLSRVRGKHYFEAYIPAALRTLQSNLSDKRGEEFPALKKVVEKIFQTIRSGKAQIPKAALMADTAREQSS